MKKTLLLSLTALASFSLSAQTLIKTTRGSVNTEFVKKTSSKEKQVLASLVCNTAYIAGSTMDLNFTFSPSTDDGEYIADFVMTFPTGITPNTSGTNTDPFMATNFGQPAADLTISGQNASWISGDATFGGIITDEGTIDFTVNVTIGGNVSGDQTASFDITGDGFSGTPSSVQGSVNIADNNVPFIDAKVVATALSASYDRNNGNFYATSNCGLSNLPVACRIANLGNTAIANFPVSYQFNGGTAVTETVTSTIEAGDSLWYYFTTPVATITQDAHEVRSYVSVQTDINLANDTSIAVNFTNSISTDLSAGAYTNSLSTLYDVFSLRRGWIGSGAPFRISTSVYNTAPYGLFFSPSVVSGYPEGTYSSYALTACVDVEAGASYVVKYFRKSNSSTTATVNGETAILTGETTVLADLETIRAFTAITPNDGTTGAWELDSTIYVATTSGTRYFAIAGRAQTTGTAQAPTLVGNVRIDDIEVYQLSGVGLEENTTSNFSIFPNPANDVVTVSLSNVSGTIRLLAADGKVIESREVSSTTENFNVKSLNAGIYFFQVGQTIQKLMVK